MTPFLSGVKGDQTAAAEDIQIAADIALAVIPPLQSHQTGDLGYAAPSIGPEENKVIDAVTRQYSGCYGNTLIRDSGKDF